jgi:hypothetical protein
MDQAISSNSTLKDGKGRQAGRAQAKDLKVCCGCCCCISSDFLKMPDAAGTYSNNTCLCFMNEFICCKPSLNAGEVLKDDMMICCEGRRVCVYVRIKNIIPSPFLWLPTVFTHLLFSYIHYLIISAYHLLQGHYSVLYYRQQIRLPMRRRCPLHMQRLLHQLHAQLSGCMRMHILPTPWVHHGSLCRSKLKVPSSLIPPEHPTHCS